jgi:hypothetical protein
MIKFSDELKKWEAWTQEYEMTALETLWVKKEIDLQDEVRRSAEERMLKAQKPAYTSELFSLDQVLSNKKRYLTI